MVNCSLTSYFLILHSSGMSDEDSTDLLTFGSFKSLSQENPTEGRILFQCPHYTLYDLRCMKLNAYNISTIKNK